MAQETINNLTPLIATEKDNLPDNIIAVAVQINEEGAGQHSGLIIGVNKEYKLFHYTGTEVQLINIPNGQWYYHKSLEIIDVEESLTFLAHCELIIENANPSYGFIFDGSYYKDGKYISTTGLGEKTTCVGFCINTITGFLVKVEQYFNLDDWGLEERSSDYFDRFIIENSHIKPDEVKQYFKRIRPSEYTASAYLNDLPIRKAAIDEIIEQVEGDIKSKRIV